MENEKKLYWQLSDNGDVSNVTLTLEAAFEWIKNEVESVIPSDSENYEYTLNPVWLTDEEFEALPEADI
jgi:hypothetical protein